jgi:hypothetical protein
MLFDKINKILFLFLKTIEFFIPFKNQLINNLRSYFNRQWINWSLEKLSNILQSFFIDFQHNSKQPNFIPPNFQNLGFLLDLKNLPSQPLHQNLIYSFGHLFDLLIFSKKLQKLFRLKFYSFLCDIFQNYIISLINQLPQKRQELQHAQINKLRSWKIGIR